MIEERIVAAPKRQGVKLRALRQATIVPNAAALVPADSAPPTHLMQSVPVEAVRA